MTELLKLPNDLRKSFYKKTGESPLVEFSFDCSDDSYFKHQEIEVPAIEYMMYLEDMILALKAQLTWRSAINEPPENEGQQLCRWSWQDNCHFRNYDLRFGWGNVTEKEIKDLLWLPIPKEATDD